MVFDDIKKRVQHRSIGVESIGIAWSWKGYFICSLWSRLHKWGMFWPNLYQLCRA